MNVFLKFKSPEHKEAYTQDHALHLQKRLRMIFLAFIFSVITLTIMFLMEGQSVTPAAAVFFPTKAAIILILAISIYFLSKKNSARIMKHINKINVVLDIMLSIVQFSYYPLVTSASTKGLGAMGVFTWIWANGFLYSHSLYLISNVWIRIVMTILQFSYFIMFTFLRETKAVPASVGALFTLIICVGWIYTHERYERLNFLEKRKAYENYEALKKIFDDVSQGIAIIDKNNYSSFYENHSLGRIFDSQAKVDWKWLSSRIKVRKITPSIEVIGKSRIVNDTENDGETPFYLSDYMDSITRTLFESNQKAQSAVAAETSWASSCSSEETQTKSLLIKFTPSLFMGKAVVVINVADTTARDHLIAAEASSAYKSRLLASVSHELRTPLNGSMNFTEQAINDPTVPHQVKQKCLIPALRAGQLLLSLINDILDFSQMQAGKLRLVFESKNVFVTAKECIDLLEIQANKKGITLELKNYLKPRQQLLYTDHNRLRQVILNLLSNAVKFTFKGGVTLILEAAPNKHEMPKGVKITCQDTGIGINEKDQKKLFQAFEKIELGENASLNSTGVGLGLIISNNLVHCLNNPRNSRWETETTEADTLDECIRFVSKEGAGSSFHFCVYTDRKEKRKKSSDLQILTENFEDAADKHQYVFTESIALMFEEPLRNSLHEYSPLRTFKNSFISSPSNPREPKSGNPLLRTLDDPLFKLSIDGKCSCPQILVVDDDAFNLTALEQILHKLHFTCDLAFHGAEALEKIQQRQVNRCSSLCQQYKVMFLDCNMPVMNGYETCKILRKKIKDGVIDEIKVIACTATADVSELERTSSAGTDSYCIKPVTSNVIRKKLSEVGL